MSSYVHARRSRSRWRRAVDRLLERGPAGEPVLARERVLHVAQGRIRGRVGNRSLEARCGSGGVCAERVEPALRFLLETLEATAAGRARRSWDLPPLRLKSAEHRQEKGSAMCREPAWVGGFPCRGQGAAAVT